MGEHEKWDGNSVQFEERVEMDKEAGAAVQCLLMLSSWLLAVAFACFPF